MQYKVKWKYKSSLGGPWMKGDVIDLKEDLAKAINIDSPGVLAEVKEVKKIDHEKHESNEKNGFTAENNRLGKAEETRGELSTDLETDKTDESGDDGGADDGSDDDGSDDAEKEDPEKDTALVGDRGREELIDKTNFRAVKESE